MLALLFSLSAQYPLIPTPVLDFKRLGDSVTASGYLAARQTSQSRNTTFSIPRARLTVMSQPTAYAAVRIQADFSATDSTGGVFTPGFTLTDAYVQLSPAENTIEYERYRPALIVGQFKTPFTQEFLTPYSALLTPNRSQAADSLGTRRDIGVMGSVQAMRWLTLAGSVTNGAGSNQPKNPTGQEMVIGRVTVQPIINSLAVSGKVLSHGSDRRWGGDFRWLSQPVPSMGQLILDGEMIRRQGSVTPGKATDGSGGYVMGLWRVLWWLEPLVKWEQLHETHEVPASEHDLTWVTYGAVLRNMSVNERVRCQINYVVKTERPVPAPNQFIVQMVLVY